MNSKDLFEGEELHGEPVLYVDENCTIPYTGHIEEYFNGKISWECDIVNGLQNGIEKTYYDNTGELERVNEIKDNMGSGLCVEYYKNGKISSISILIGNVNVDYYSYNEEGKLRKVYVMDDKNEIGIDWISIKDKIPAYRKKYNLEKINEKILKNMNDIFEFF